MSLERLKDLFRAKTEQEDGENSSPTIERENLEKALGSFEQYLSQNPDLLANLTDLSQAQTVIRRLAAAYSEATDRVLKNDFPDTWEAYMTALDNQRRDRFYKGAPSIDRIQLLLDYMRTELGRKPSRTRR